MDTCARWNMADEQKQPGKRVRRRRGSVEEPKRLTEWHINAMDVVFPGFGAFYRAHYDEQGKLIARVPGLQPAVKEGE